MIYIKRYYKVVLWLLLIFSLSSIPNARINENNSWDLIIRKTAHITEYAILFILVANSLKKEGLKHSILVSFVFTVLYAASDEYHQSFVAGRGPSPMDVVVDTIGASLGFIYLKTLWTKTPMFIRRIFS